MKIALGVPDFVLAGTCEKEKESAETRVDSSVMSFPRPRHQNQLQLRTTPPPHGEGEKVRLILV